MLALTHLALSAAATVTIGKQLDLLPDAVGWCMIGLGSLAPDIDLTTSTISRPGRLLRRLVGWRWARILDLLGQFVSLLFSLVFRHRGATHWPIIPILVGAGAFLFSREWLFWFSWGYLWHLFGDLVTTSGIPLLAPYTRRSISALPLRTGSLTERFLCILLLAHVCHASWPILPEHTRRWMEEFRGLFG